MPMFAVFLCCGGGGDERGEGGHPKKEVRVVMVASTGGSTEG